MSDFKENVLFSFYQIKGRRRRGQEKTRRLDNIINSMDMNLSNLLEAVKDREAWPTALHRVAKSQIWLSDWTTTNGLSHHLV